MSKKNKVDMNYFGASENEGPKEEKTDGPVQLPYTLTFRNPVQIGKKERTEIVFVKEPTAKCLRHMPVDTEQQMLGHFYPVISGMTDKWTTAQVEELPMKALYECISIVTPFLAPSETT